MSFYVQYHNHDKEGLPLGDSEERLGIHTRLSHVQQSKGGQVFLIFGIGSPRRFYLWDTFTVEAIDRCQVDDGPASYHASGPGWFLRPPQRLEGPDFDAFKRSCANLIGFRKFDSLPYCETLKQLAADHQDGDEVEVRRFAQDLADVLTDDETAALEEHFTGLELEVEPVPMEEPVQERKPVPNQTSAPKRTPEPTKLVPRKVPAVSTVEVELGLKPLRALSIRQPHAEAIMRGVKKIEYRSAPTKIRGDIYIYASLGRYSAQEEAEMLAEYGIDDVACDGLPRGVLVGTVELFDCDDGKWHVRNPVRLTKPPKPTRHPQPVWFNPF